VRPWAHLQSRTPGVPMSAIASTVLKVAAIVVCLGTFTSACYVQDGGYVQGGYVRTVDRPVYVHNDDHRHYEWSHR
jgi:hypothetical protein